MRISTLALRAVLLATAALSARAAADTSVVSAVVRAVDPVGGGVTIEIGRELFGREMRIEAGATITIDSQPAKLADLAAGMKATVLVDVKAGLVKRISARSDPKAAKSSKPDESASKSAKSDDEPDGEPGPAARDRRSKKEDDEAFAAVLTTGECPPELEAVDELIRRHMVAKRIRGAAVAVVKDGRCVLARGYGHADEKKSALVEPDTLFPVAGVSRVFTGVAVLKLAEDGKLQLTDKFVDVAGLPLAGVDERIKNNSPFFKITLRDMLNDAGSLDNDAFLAGLFRNPEAKAATALVVAGMPDREGFVFDDENPMKGLDLQYMLLGRLVARAAGGRYEPYVKRTIFDALGKSEAKVEIVGVGELEEKDQGKRRRRSGKAQRQEEGFDGVAQVMASAREPYEDSSMRIDASGGWVCSVMDLARFAKAFDDPAKSPLLKEESIETMLGGSDRGKRAEAVAPGAADRAFAQAKKDAAPRRKTGGAHYFSCGWEVYASKGKKDESTTTVRRYAHSGPASLVSEGNRHVILLFTSAAPSEKSRGEHPLMKDVDLALDKIEAWPEVDYFKTAPSAQPKAMPAGEVASATPAPAPAAPTPQGSGLPKPPAPQTTKDRIMAIFGECIVLNEEFMANGGQAFAVEVARNGNDFPAAAKQAPQVKAALDKMVNRLAELITASLQISTSGGSSADMEVAGKLNQYLNLRYRVAKALAELIEGGRPPDQQKFAVKQYFENEAAMSQAMNAFLAAALNAYPPDYKPASSLAEFQQAITVPALFVGSALSERTLAVNARRGQIISIQAKGAGANVAEQYELQSLYKEIQQVGARLRDGLQPVQEMASKYAEAEAAAPDSKYAEAWKAMESLVAAEAAMCGYLAKYGEGDGGDEEKIDADLTQARQKFQAAMAALQDAGQAATP